ncbi:MAG TPA: 4Fe-4S dicluster domain-containing protein [Phycisphaerae bacterium]|nr:4Fe-4S dicluster domain-containing protein [Phycisphaerae bacterium]
MLPQVLKKSDLGAWVAAIGAERRVAAPVLKETSPADPSDQKFGWEHLADPADVRLDYTLTVLGPKKFLWPPRQALVAYSLAGDPKPQPLIDHEPQVLFGVDPCDITAIATLDAAFGKDVPDPHYLARRADTAIIGLDCDKPCDETSFCLDMGSLYPETGYDAMLTPLEDGYFVETKTELGQALVEAAKVRPATKQDMQARQAFAEAKRSQFHFKLPCEVKYLPEVLDASYDSLVWEAIARRCFSCGSCNTTCPTCYCWDAYEDVAMDLTKGCHVRRYDSCQLDPFAEVAGGENFRKNRSSRLRHRMFRKGKYILEQTGRVGCVGCGRCERACIAGISIRETFVQIAGSR